MKTDVSDDLGFNGVCYKEHTPEEMDMCDHVYCHQSAAEQGFF